MKGSWTLQVAMVSPDALDWSAGFPVMSIISSSLLLLLPLPDRWCLGFRAEGLPTR